jgi:L-asparaginase
VARFFENIFYMTPELIVLGTGGTIAGTAASRTNHTGYTAAQIGVATLLQGVQGLHEALDGHTLVSEQVAQLDSKDMDFATMLRIAQRCVHFLAQEQVRGLVITHGTDTLEETAYFLHLMIPPELQTKPIVLTCAMRPATSQEADGPRNLTDAVTLALDAKARGVLVVCAGDVHHAVLVQKMHSYALNAFSSGDVELGEPGCMAKVDDAQVRWSSHAAQIFEENRPIAHIEYKKFAIEIIANKLSVTIHWPRVEIILNHSHATGSIVNALLHASTPDDPLRAIVVAATGNGTISDALQSALISARSKGVDILLSSRCAWGGVRGHSGQFISETQLSAVKARIAWVCKNLKI